MMTYDNGRGRYTFCKRGLSHCTDQHCDCIDTAGYRALYQLARERRGWTMVTENTGLPSHLIARLVCAALCGGIVGALIVWGMYLLDIHVPV